MLVAVCGLPGTGKSTVARRIAERLDAAVLRTDIVRRDIRTDPTYTPEERRAVYTELADRARQRLTAGESVVLDGTFHRTQYRDRIRGLADGIDVHLMFVKVVCDEETVRRRITARENDASEADFEVYLEHRDDFDPLPDPDIVIDNTGALEETYAQIDPHF